MTDFELAGRHLGQHRCEERVVVAAKHDDLGFVRAQTPLEPAGHGHSGKAPAKDYDDRHESRLKTTAWIPPAPRAAVVRRAAPSSQAGPTA